MYEFNNRKTGEKLKCEFRVVSAENAEEIKAFQDCVRDEYGESYPRKSMYDIAAFTDEIRAGTVFPMLAVSESGETVSSLALTPCESFDDVPEMTMHVVRKAYRGFGVGTVLTKALLQQPQARERCAVTAHSVTFHPKAQHQTLSCGFVPTGFQLSIHRNDVLHHSFPVDGVRKQSFAVSVFPEKKRDAGTLYLPEEHRDFIEDIYMKLGTAHRTGSSGGLSARTDMHMHEDELHHTTTAELFSCGCDLKQWAEQMLSRKNPDDQTINLLINMNDPAAPEAYKLLKELGFFFSGIHPLCANGEFLIMHHPMKLSVPFDKLCIDEGYREVFAYIKDRA